MIGRRELLWAGVGGVFAAAGCGHRARWLGQAVPRAGPVAMWGADRAAHRVVGLDRDAIRAIEFDVPAPVGLTVDRGGLLWIASAVELRPAARHLLIAVRRSGEVVLRRGIDGILSLAPANDGNGCVVSLRGPRGTRLERHDIEGSRVVRPPWRTALTAEANGRWWSADRRGRVRCGRRRGDEVPRGCRPTAVVPDPDGRAAWLVAAGVSASCVGRWRVGDDGVPRRAWLRWIGLAPCAHGVVARTRSLWLADARLPRIARFGIDAQTEVSVRDLPLGGVESLVVEPSGGCLLAAGGALLRIDSQGRNLPGQGGFEHLVDVARDA